MDEQQQQPVFDWTQFQNSLRKTFPFISDEYWSMISGIGNPQQFIDWNEFGKYVVNQSWVSSFDDKEFIERFIQKVIKN